MKKKYFQSTESARLHQEDFRYPSAIPAAGSRKQTGNNIPVVFLHAGFSGIFRLDRA